MSTFLFNEVIFGPVRSRRLGLSLGINLLPDDKKYCSFNCIYCECGWTHHASGFTPSLPSREEVKEYLRQKLMQMVDEEYIPDALTFAGNGEPTLHPDFAGIVNDTIHLRDEFVPQAKITVLSNASMIHKKEIFDALLLLDNNIQKLDAGFQELFDLINNPVSPVRVEKLVEDLQKFEGNVIIQSMFLKGRYKNHDFDNTGVEEISSWLEKIDFIRPSNVMIYSLDRATPLHDLTKIPRFELDRIAMMVRELGVKASVY